MDKTPQKEVKTEQKTIEPEGLIVAPGEKVVHLAYVRKKREYRIFIKMIKAGKISKAIATAKMIGVSYNTVREWLKTPAAIRASEDSIDKYIQIIESSKDWKAAAYLLDKITGDSEKVPAGPTQNVLIINKDGEYKIGVKG